MKSVAKRPLRKSPRLKDYDYATPNIVVLVTIAAHGKKRTFGDENAAGAVMNAVCAERGRLSHAIYAYCIMPDHVHLLVSPLESGEPVTAFIQGLKSRVTSALHATGHEGKVFQRSFHDHVVRKDGDLRAVAEYILNNPVRAGLAQRPEEYPFSGCMDPLPV